MQSSKIVVGVLSDLFFTVKINDAAKRAGMTPKFVKTELDAITLAEAGVALMILDLTCHTVDALALIGKLKANPETTGIPLIAFLPHVEGELKQAAQKAGCDLVLAKSAFSINLLQLMQRHSRPLPQSS